MSEPLLHTVEEAAQLLGLSRAYAFRLISEGVLESVTIGRSRRVPHDALVTFVDRLRSEPVGA